MRAAVCLAVIAAALAGGAAAACADENLDCGEWQLDGHCAAAETRDWMLWHCPVSCGSCGPATGAPQASDDAAPGQPPGHARRHDSPPARPRRVPGRGPTQLPRDDEL
ncbi:hypothetical protein M885DRAFT_550166 [Pelagophyceae sp. CCMP2097]|nr:hypothetical protein M885DRAFT_550166 [Pelagophyceae sp. CCMP2097]